MIVHPALEQRMPQELDGVAGLPPAGKPSASPNQLRRFQLGKIFLGLAFPYTDFLCCDRPFRYRNPLNFAR
jgi:hypothetical protein